MQLQRLVDAGNTVVMIEHDMRSVAQADWVIDVGPGAGSAGGTIVAAGPPHQVARAKGSRTAPFLRASWLHCRAEPCSAIDLQRRKSSIQAAPFNRKRAPAPCRSPRCSLLLQERQQVLVDLVLVGVGQAVRRTRVDNQLCALDELCRLAA